MWGAGLCRKLRPRGQRREQRKDGGSESSVRARTGGRWESKGGNLRDLQKSWLGAGLRKTLDPFLPKLKGQGVLGLHLGYR